MKLTPAVLLLALAATGAGCFTPSPVVRLYPDDPGAVWRDGRGIISRRGPAYRMAAAFDHQAADKIVVRLEAENTGTGPLDMDPMWLAFMTCTGPHVCATPKRVLDPEAALIAMDQAQARQRASQENAAAFGGVLLLLDTAAAVGSVASGKPAHAAAFVEHGAATVALTDASMAGSQANIERIQLEKENWAAVALRKTTLFPGQGVAGYVYLPVDTSATQVWLRVRIPGLEEVWFPFKQTVIGGGVQ